MTELQLDFSPFIISTGIFWRDETPKYFNVSAKNENIPGTSLSDYSAGETPSLLYIPARDAKPQ